MPALLALGCILRWPSAGLAVQMAARLDRAKVYLDTQTALIVDVTDPTSAEWPVVAPVDGLQISHYRPPGITRDLISGSTRATFIFLINPTRAGEFKIPSVTLGAGPNAITQGPFALQVVAAPIKFVSAQLESREVSPGERTRLFVTYQGSATGKSLTLPKIDGLTLGSLGLPRVEMTRQEGLPISKFPVGVSTSQLGTYEIKGISLEGVPADPVTLQVSSFVISRTEVADSSLLVGERTLIQLQVRGRIPPARLSLVAPPGLKIQPAPQSQSALPGTVVFSFEATATEPGSPTITALQLADGKQVPLANPIRLSVRSQGESDILGCRGSARTEESILGEPFIVDYEVFFRGDLQAAGIDLSQTEFGNRPHIKVELIKDLSYPGWSGQPTPVQFDGRRDGVMFSGAGEWNGKKEQSLRFALKITPLAAGPLELKGVRVILALQIVQEQSGPGMFSRSISTQERNRTIDIPPHRVLDPPGVRQPAGYQGAVGSSFTYAASLDRTTATAMSPLTLTLKITGEGVGPQFKPPSLSDVKELVRDFDLAPTIGGGEVQDNTITFTQVIRPRSETVKELPALPLIYYDYVGKKYDTVYSLPIAITVTPGSVVGATDMQTRSDPVPPSSGAPASQQSEVAPRVSRTSGPELVPLGANSITLGEVATGEPLSPGGVIAVLLAGPCLILATWGGRKWYAYRRPLASVRQQRRALAEALEQVTRRDDFYAALADLVQAYLRLTFALPPGEVSMETLAREFDRKAKTASLASEAADGDLLHAIEELLMRCDTGRFTATGIDEAEKAQVTEQARRLFVRLDRL